MTRKTRSIFTVFFTLYFVFYAVFPLSAALPREQSDIAEWQGIYSEAVFSPLKAFALFTESPAVKEQRDDQLDPFIFDMALWEILKKGRTADDAGRNKFVVKKIGPKNIPEKDMCCMFESDSVVPIPFTEAISSVQINHIPLHINAPYLYSGLSPPVA